MISYVLLHRYGELKEKYDREHAHRLKVDSDFNVSQPLNTDYHEICSIIFDRHLDIDSNTWCFVAINLSNISQPLEYCVSV